MSCGKHHETPCSEVLEQVYIYLDGEIDKGDYNKVRQHLDEGGPCLRQFDLDKAVKALVARSCGCEIASDALRGKVLARIREVRIQLAQTEQQSE